MSRLIDVAAVLDRMAKALAGTEQGEACAFAVRLMRERESAAPAKHPDTYIVDWVEANHRTVMALEDGSFSCWSVDGHEFRGTTAREVIDAARKQEASK